MSVLSYLPIRWFKSHWFWLKWLLAAALMSWLVSSNWKNLANLSERQIRWDFFALAFATCLIGVILTFFRWYLLVRAVDLPMTLKEAFRLGSLGLMCNYIGPGAVGGDLIKGMILAKGHPERRAAAAASVIYDRVLGLVALVIVGATAALLPTTLPFNAQLQLIMTLTWVAAGAGILGLVVIQSPFLHRYHWDRFFSRFPVGGKLAHQLFQAATLYKDRTSIIVACVGISIFGHLFMLFSFYLCAETIRGNDPIPDLVAHLRFIPAAEVFGVLIPTPGGMGALEGAIKAFYSLTVDPHDAAAVARAAGNGLLMAITSRVIQVAISAIGLIYYFAARREFEALPSLDENPDSETESPQDPHKVVISSILTDPPSLTEPAAPR